MVFIKFYILAVVLSNRIHRRLNQCCNRTAVRAVGVKQGDGGADEGTGCRVIAVCFFLCLGKESGDGCLVCRHIRCNERGSALKEGKNLIPGAVLCCGVSVTTGSPSVAGWLTAASVSGWGSVCLLSQELLLPGSPARLPPSWEWLLPLPYCR